jgi:hypothetical protein
MKLKCQVGEKYILFVMCGLAGFWEDLGLDKIFGAGIQRCKPMFMKNTVLRALQK